MVHFETHTKTYSLRPNGFKAISSSRENTAIAPPSGDERTAKQLWQHEGKWSVS